MKYPDLDLLDELLGIVEGTDAIAVDVVAKDVSIRIRRRPTARAPVHDEKRGAATPRSDATQVKSPAVGIFSAEREWKVGDKVERGAVLGGVQSLGHVAEITAPIEGAIREILTASGAPVEYGQPLFAIEGAS
jgi:biotin carboxyl carrier protein